MEEFEELDKNIISWYPFKKNSEILEIWEEEQIQLLFLEENLNKKYDYIVLIGFKHQNKIEEAIQNAITKLKEDGIILLSVDNKIGINKLCTQTEENINTFIGRKKLEKILDFYQLQYKKFYYPLPNYKRVNVIFTDEWLPSFETINRNLTLYDEEKILVLDENDRIESIVEEDIQLFKKLANSFFVECSKRELEENDIRFVTFSNIRKPEYRIKTIIQGDKVYKYSANVKSKQHIEDVKENIDMLNKLNFNLLDSYDENRIISKYQNPDYLLYSIIISMLKNGKIDETLDLINKFKTELVEKLEKSNIEDNCFIKYNINYEPEVIENLNFIKHGFWDLIFQNCFYINNKFYFYDQEWREENIPVEFILYRAIKYCSGISNFLEKEQKYSLLNITSEQQQLFDKLDDILQMKTRDDKIWERHLFQESKENTIKKLKKVRQYASRNSATRI